jgi:uncharacterized membrane protein
MKIRERINQKNSFEIVIFSLIFLFGLIWTFLVPPFQKADESTHYFRAASVSRGELTCSMGDVEEAFEIRERHFKFAEAVGTSRVAFKYEEKVDIKDMLEAGSDVDDDNPNIVLWDYGCNLSFIPYLIFAVPLLIGGLFDSLLLGFYLSRLVAFILFFIAILWSFKKTSNSKFKWIIVFYALTPMVLHQASAIGYDYLTLTLIPIIFALSIDFLQKEKVSKKEIIIYCLLLILLSLAKPGYYFLSLLYFLIPVKKVSKSKNKYLLFTLIFFVIYIIVNRLAQNLFSSLGSELNNTGLVIEKLREPGALYDVINNTIKLKLDFYVESFIGRFGWLDYSLSPLFKYLYIGLFYYLAYYISSEKIFKKYWKLIALLSIMLFLSLGIIFGGFYVLNFRGDNSQVVGVQGRYFLVFLPFIFMLLGSIIRAFKENKVFRIVVIGGIFLYTLYQMWFSIYSRYYEKVETNSYSIDSTNTILARRDIKAVGNARLYKIPTCEPM